MAKTKKQVTTEIDVLYRSNPKKAFWALKAITNTLRTKMLRIIESEESINVTTLYKKMGITQSVCSSHLRLLRQAGVVKFEREGNLINYSINKPNIVRIAMTIADVVAIVEEQP